jgi:hypothetical protein
MAGTAQAVGQSSFLLTGIPDDVIMLGASPPLCEFDS